MDVGLLLSLILEKVSCIEVMRNHQQFNILHSFEHNTAISLLLYNYDYYSSQSVLVLASLWILMQKWLYFLNEFTNHSLENSFPNKKIKKNKHAQLQLFVPKT